MSDSASQANELRLLEQKRLRGGLSPAEDARRGVLAAEAPPPRGFDVNAAAAEIRALRETDAPPSCDAAALEPQQSAFAARPPAAEPPPVVPAAAPADPAASLAPVPEPSFAAAPIPEASGEGAPPDAAELVPFFPGAALTSGRELAAPPADPPPECVDVADAAPVYDAAAYGLDPDDPNAVAWAAWYAAQGWDPATAYAYAQRMNAEAEAGAAPAEPDEERERPALVAPDLAPSPAAFAEAPAPPEEAPSDVLPELPAEPTMELAAEAVLEPILDAGPRPTADLEDAIPELPAEPIEPAVVPGEEPIEAARLQPIRAPSAADSIPELPPIALEALDAAEELAPVEAPQLDIAMDLGPGFDAEPIGAAPGDGAPRAEIARADLSPEPGWAEHAVPGRDEPVDFSAFDAEPTAVGAADPSAADTQRTAMWELGGALHDERPSAAEVSPVEIAPAEEMPRAGLDLGSALAWHDAPGTSGEPTTPAAPGQLRDPAEALELPPAEPIELQDDAILEVGDDDVVEIAEYEADPAPEPPVSDAFAPSGEPPGPSPAPLLDLSGLDAPDASPLPPPEPSVAFGATASDPPLAAGAAPRSLETPWVAPEPDPEPPGPRQATEPPPAPAAFVAGTHRVVLHTVDGQVRRGTVADVALDAAEVLLTPQGGGAAEGILAEQIKAIFFMLPPGQAPVDPDGMRVRVTFRDGRQLAGFSADYAAERPGFFVIPADTRTHTARIWVYRSAVRQVSVS